MGQQSEEGLKNEVGLQASPQFYDKIRPFLGLKTEDAVHGAGLNEKDLVITLDEGIVMDKAFNVRKSCATILDSNAL